jgi:hypothetical protein
MNARHLLQTADCIARITMPFELKRLARIAQQGNRHLNDMTTSTTHATC